MLLVIPCWPEGEWLTLKSLDWIKELDGRIDTHAVISFEAGMDISKIKEKAASIFTTITEVIHRKTNKSVNSRKWPKPQNAAFQDTVREMEKIFPPIESFLWWENDAVPIKPGWFKAIEDCHNKAGKPFSGVILDHPNWHFNGVAVYPMNFTSRCPNAMYAFGVPWDTIMSKEVPHSLVNSINHISQHIYRYEDRNVERQAPTFPNRAMVDKLVHPDCVLFHRCKDGTLIDRLREIKCSESR